MKFLVAELRLNADKNIVVGEPVIPAFHIPNMFLGVNSGHLCVSAKVGETDVDLVKRQLMLHYPGIPEAMIDFYVTQTALVADTVKDPEALFRVFCSATTANLQNIRTQELIPMWTEFDSAKYL
jgi:hypothetical protein